MDDNDRIEKLKEQLYSRTNAPEPNIEKRTPLAEREFTVGDTWKDTEEKPTTKDGDVKKKTKKHSVPLIILAASIIFLCIAGGISAYYFMRGLNVVSADKVEMVARGPVSVAAGEPLSYEVVVTNNNTSALSHAQLTVDYPTGTRVNDETHTSLSRYTQELDGVKPSETVRVNLDARLFGEKDSTQTIIASLEYGLADSSGVFTKKITYPITISSAPVIMKIDRPQAIFPGQSIPYKVTITSNSNVPVKDVLVRAEYPYGFTVDSTTPQQFSGNNIWKIDTIEPGKSAVITILGHIQSQAGEQATVSFSAGTQGVADPAIIGSLYAKQQDTITIAKPIIDLGITFDTPQPQVAKMGSLVRAHLTWKNNSTETLRNVQITLALTGDVLDKTKTDVSQGGFYQSADDVITWDKNSTNTLLSIKPGDSGSFDLSFQTQKPSSTFFFTKRDPHIDTNVVVHADKNNGERISAEFPTVIKIVSDVSPTSEAVFSTGPFNNSGPYPPRVEQQSTYTIVWRVKNSYNALSNTHVTAKLPAYVTWLGNVSPAGAVTYDPASRQVTWNVNNVSAGAGYVTSSPEANFQIAFTPSANQLNKTPDLIIDTIFSALDVYTQQGISRTLSNINTHLTKEDTGEVIATGEVRQ